MPAFQVWLSWLCGGTASFVHTEYKEWFCNDKRSVFAFISILDMQDVFSWFYSKQLRRTGMQDENQQGVQARHT